ncbi:SAM-dependent methyltransferase [Methanobacterium sp.]|uniref:SAM-dependent methyltransferase n=1 Tax=Methanobacterium sp. TaxID=2164 RepID=UPI003C74750C
MSENNKKVPSRTAEDATLIRMGESRKPEGERICYDPLAIHFISQETLELLQKNPEMDKEKEIIFRGVANTIAARVRYFDDFVKKSIDDGIEQLVILGAGYDTRAYRIEGLKENVKVFEVDHPGTQGVKIEKINEIFGSLPGYVEYVSVDFEIEPLDHKLLNRGYSDSKKTLFVMEGLTHYIPPKAVIRILSFIVKNSSKGSAVIFDYGSIPANIDENQDLDVAENIGKSLDESGEQVQFALKEGTVKKFLSKRGFSNIKDVTSKDYKKAYFHGKNKDREVYSLISFAHAVVE